MVEHKYGSFGDEQFEITKQNIRKQIFFLLLYVDPKTKQEYQNVNVNNAFKGLLYKLGGLNSILYEPPELVTIISLLESAWEEYNNINFSFYKYRKLILDAGSEVLKIKEVK